MKLVDILKAQDLTDEQISKIQASMKENKVYETSLENADERYNKLKNQKDDLKSQLDTANTTIEDLKKNNKDNETLQNTIKEHEATIANLKKESLEFKKDTLIDSKFSNVKEDDYREFLKSKIDKEKISFLEDGTPEGLEEQYKMVTEKYPNLTGEKTPGGKGFNPGGEPPKEKGDSATCFIDAIRNNQLRK